MTDRAEGEPVLCPYGCGRVVPWPGWHCNTPECWKARGASTTELQMQHGCDKECTGMSDWSDKTEWMRAARATHAEWFPDGTLRAVTLAPDAPATDVGPAEQQETAFARQQRERKERRELAQRASGGPVPRLDEGH